MVQDLVMVLVAVAPSLIAARIEEVPISCVCAGSIGKPGN
jgi:hypothetical protein